MLIYKSDRARKYRVNRKRRPMFFVKAKERFSLIAFTCKAIAILAFVGITPLIILALPLFLIILAFATFADSVNRFGYYFERTKNRS